MKKTTKKDLKTVLSYSLVPISYLLVIFLCGFKFLAPLDNEKGNRYYKKGQVGKAKSAYSEALKADPASHPIAFNLGNTYYKEEAYSRSADLYQKATHGEKDPSLKAKALYNLGNSMARRRESEKAIEFYKESLRINPKDRDAKYNLEMLLQRQDKKEEDQKKKNQNQQSQEQKKDQQNQGSSSGSDKSSGSGQEKKESGEEGQRQNQSASSAGNQQEKDNKENKDKQPGGGEKEQPQEKREQSGAAGGVEKKSEAEKQAEQILNALGDHEQQVLKLSGDRKNLARPQRISEQDW